MFCRKELYLKMQKSRRKTLEVIYQSNKTYEKLLKLSEIVSIHQWHLKSLVSEVYQSTSYFNPKVMCSFFTHKEIPYNLRKGQVLSLPPARTTYYGTNSVHFRGSLIWNSLPGYIKSSRSVCEFKNNTKNFRGIDCGCLICRTWILRRNCMHTFLLLLLLFLFSLLLYFVVSFYWRWAILMYQYYIKL